MSPENSTPKETVTYVSQLSSYIELADVQKLIMGYLSLLDLKILQLNPEELEALRKQFEIQFTSIDLASSVFTERTDGIEIKVYDSKEFLLDITKKSKTVPTDETAITAPKTTFSIDDYVRDYFPSDRDKLIETKSAEIPSILRDIVDYICLKSSADILLPLIEHANSPLSMAYDVLEQLSHPAVMPEFPLVLLSRVFVDSKMDEKRQETLKDRLIKTLHYHPRLLERVVGKSNTYGQGGSDVDDKNLNLLQPLYAIYSNSHSIQAIRAEKAMEEKSEIAITIDSPANNRSRRQFVNAFFKLAVEKNLEILTKLLGVQVNNIPAFALVLQDMSYLLLSLLEEHMRLDFLKNIQKKIPLLTKAIEDLRQRFQEEKEQLQYRYLNIFGGINAYLKKHVQEISHDTLQNDAEKELYLLAVLNNEILLDLNARLENTISSLKYKKNWLLHHPLTKVDALFLFGYLLWGASVKFSSSWQGKSLPWLVSISIAAAFLVIALCHAYACEEEEQCFPPMESLPLFLRNEVNWFLRRDANSLKISIDSAIDWLGYEPIPDTFKESKRLLKKFKLSTSDHTFLSSSRFSRDQDSVPLPEMPLLASAQVERNGQNNSSSVSFTK